MAAPPPNFTLDLSRTTGQILIAGLLATGFWGIQCIQTMIYLLTYQSDKRQLKILVICLLLLVTLHEIFCIRALWLMLIPKFGDIPNFTNVVTQILFTLPVSGFITLLAQLFFTWRIWRFTNKNWIFPVILVPASIGQLVGYVVYTVKAIGKPVPILLTPVLTKLTSSIGLLVAIVDILIALIMCSILWRSRTGGQFGTNRVILRLMNASVSTGACTAIFAIYGVITSLLFPNDFLYALGLIPIPSLYCNTVLANLNSRRFFRQLHSGMPGAPSSGLGRRSLHSAPAVELNTFGGRRNSDVSYGKSLRDTTPMVVHVAHETTTVTDI